MSGRDAVAFGAGLIAFLCLGIWLGGHPAKLPEFVRDAFVNSSASLPAAAGKNTAILKNNIYESPAFAVKNNDETHP